jgi:hypothetical protein
LPPNREPLAIVLSTNDGFARFSALRARESRSNQVLTG